jgi:hypothetical protein
LHELCYQMARHTRDGKEYRNNTEKKEKKIEMERKI